MTEFTYDHTDIHLRYGTARKLPVETMRLWLDTIAQYVPHDAITTILDVGCGTGRFTGALSERFGAHVIGIDPSMRMLAEARKLNSGPNILYVRADAEHLPLNDGSAGFVYLSMVYHHLTDPDLAADEFWRVLWPGGYVGVRTSTVEFLDVVPYLEYFPTARAMNEKRLPSKEAVINTMKAHNFELISHDVVRQKFTDTLRAYCEKIGQRALSDLASISDTDFHVGLQRMAEAAQQEGHPKAIYEPIDLFVFRVAPTEGDLFETHSPV